MNIKNLFAIALVTASAFAAPMAMAADLTAPVPFDRPETFVSQSVNFDGPYAGVGVIYSNKNYTPVVSVGYDLRYDAFVVGVEAFGTVNSATPVLGADVKAGVAVTEDFALYGLVGVQTNTGTGVNSNSFGVGADLVLTETVSLTGSYKQVYDIGTFNNREDQFRVGVKFSF